MFALHHQARVVAALATLAFLAGCGDGGDSAQGSVSVGITDGPTDLAEEVWIQVSGLAFKPEGSAPEIVEGFAPRAINLLEFQQGNVAMLLDDVPFDAGRYQWLRLIVDSEPAVRDSYLIANGLECELKIPSGAQSGLKMNRGFTIEANGSLALTIDFDLRQSLHAPPGLPSLQTACTQGYILRPTLRLVDNANVGAIAGTVSFEGESVPADCLPKAYVFAGTATPDDNEETSATSPDVDPVSVVGVDIPGGSLSGTFRAAFLPVGDYTVAFTCDDDTDADESLDFFPEEGISVTVQNNLIATADFLVPVGS